MLLTSKLDTTTIIPAITESSTLVSAQTTFLTSEIAKTDKIIIPTTSIQLTSLITNAVTTTTEISTTTIAKTITSELTTTVIAKTTTTPIETTSTTIITAISTTTTTPEALPTTSLIQTTEVIPTTSTTTPPIEPTTKIIPTTTVSIATTTLKIEETSVFSTTPTLELNATSLDLTIEQEEFTTNFLSLNESTSTTKAVLSGDSNHLDDEESNYTLFRFKNGSLSIFPKSLFSRLLRFPHEIYLIVILVLLFIILVLTIMLVCLLCKRHEAKTSLYERFVENHLVDSNYVREDSYSNSTMITRIRILGDKRASILDKVDCLNERLTESKTKEEGGKENDLVRNEPRLKSKKNPFRSNQTDKLEKHKRFAKLSLFSVNPVFEDDPIFENTHL